MTNGKVVPFVKFVIPLVDGSEVLDDGVACPWLDAVHSGCHHCFNAVVDQQGLKEDRQLGRLYQALRAFPHHKINFCSQTKISFGDPLIETNGQVKILCNLDYDLLKINGAGILSMENIDVPPVLQN